MSIFFTLFFSNGTATTEIYTLSLHDALPIYKQQCRHRQVRQHDRAFNGHRERGSVGKGPVGGNPVDATDERDRKSTRLNSSHSQISYAVFCLKKKNSDPSTSPNTKNCTIAGT